MINNKEFNKNSLLKFYYGCPLFKKYCKQGLWFGSFDEYKNIKYCEKYLQKYTYIFLQKNDLFRSQSFNLDPYFIKFTHSVFFRHINSHFLIAFYENSFLCFSSRSKLRIERFVEVYFHIYLKKKLEEEILVSLTKSINRFTFNFTNFSKNKLCCKSNKKKYKVKKKDVQILFESNKFFSTFSEKKRSIGLHNGVNIVFGNNLL